MKNLFGRYWACTWTCVILAVAAQAQPYDRAIFGGQHLYDWAEQDTSNFCGSYLPLDRLHEASADFGDFIPLQPLATGTRGGLSGERVRSFSAGTVDIFTDHEPTPRLWFISNGTHTWDSTLRRVTARPLAPFAADHHGSGDADGIDDISRQLILPVRDTPGVFRHLILEWGSYEGRRLILGSGSFNRLLSYRIDARSDANARVAGGGAGAGTHLRYSPDPDEPDYVERAIVWRGDDQAYDPDVGREEMMPLATLSRLAAIPHANGRDWWVIALGGQQSPHALASFLLEANGTVRLAQLDTAALTFTPSRPSYSRSRAAQFHVSQQGDRIAFHNAPNSYIGDADTTYYGPGTGVDEGILVWTFDRCTGTFALEHDIQINYAVQGTYPFAPDFNPWRVYQGGGVAFSPSGRYLYFTEGSYVGRFNLNASDFAASHEVAYAPDSLWSLYSLPPLSGPTAFVKIHVTPGPDGVLLHHAGGSSAAIMSLGNLDDPDPANITGSVDALMLPCYNSNKFVRPYYQLYDDEGSACDTLGIHGWNPACRSWSSDQTDTVYVCDLDSDGTLEPTMWRGRELSQPDSIAYATVRTPEGCDSLWRAQVLLATAVPPEYVYVTDANAGDTLAGVVITRDTTFDRRVADMPASSPCGRLVRYVVTGVSSLASPTKSLVGRLRVYPSPSEPGKEVTILLEGIEPSRAPATLTVSDQAGRVVTTLNLDHTIRKIELLAHQIPSGVYTVTWSSARGVWVGRGLRL